MQDLNVMQALRLIAANPDKRCVIFVETRDTAETLAAILRGSSIVIVPKPSEPHHVSPVTALTALTDRARNINTIIVQLTTLHRSWCAPQGNYAIGSTYDMSQTEANIIKSMFSQSRPMYAAPAWREPAVKKSLTMFVAHMVDNHGIEQVTDGYVYALTELAMRRFKESRVAERRTADSDQSVIDTVCRIQVSEEGYKAITASIKNPNRDWYWTDRVYFTIAQPKELI